MLLLSLSNLFCNKFNLSLGSFSVCFPWYSLFRLCHFLTLYMGISSCHSVACSLRTVCLCSKRRWEFSGCWCGRGMRWLARAPSLYLFFLEKRKKWNTKCYLASPQLSYGSAWVVSDNVIDDSTECWQPEAWTFEFRSVRSETYFEVMSFSVSC